MNVSHIQTGGLRSPQDLEQSRICPASPTGQYEGRNVQSLLMSADIHKDTEAGVSLLPSSLPNQGRVWQDPPADRTSDSSPACPDLSDPNLTLNAVLQDMVALDDWIEAPPLKPKLEDDPALTETFQKTDSLAFITNQLKKRQRMEKKGDEFPFKPLMVTLKNMATFIDHIAEGKQFRNPLTAEEAAALQRIDMETRPLVEARLPLYKRTLRLALSLMLLCDIITRRQVLEPYLDDSSKLCLCRSTWLDPGRKWEPLLLEALPFTRQNCPDGKDSLPAGGLSPWMREALLETVNNPNLLLYPSFQPLTVTDFCKFGHLPVHPIGLITDYALNADGILYSPLSFAEHDLNHMSQLLDVGDPAHKPASVAEAALCNPARRLDWRCLLLGRMPDCLARRLSEPALHFLLFQLLHEHSPDWIASKTDSSCQAFLYYLKGLVGARTTQCQAYEDIYRKITIDQAAITLLWAVRLWSRWLTADCQLSEKALHDCADTFVATDLPRLQQHLAFFSRNRGTLRQLFVEQASLRLVRGGEYTFGGWYGPEQEYIIFFRSHFPEARLVNMEVTDLVYFHSICSATERHAIEKRLAGRVLPEGTASEPDTPQPAAPGASQNLAGEHHC